MSWSKGADEAGGGNYLSIPIDSEATVQIAGMYKFVEKDFGDGNQWMTEIPVHHLGNPTEDGEPVILSMGKRRSQELLRACGDIEAKGTDPTTRALKIECYAIKHPTRAGQRIGKLRVTDLGPATEHGGVSQWSAGADGAGDSVDWINEIAAAPDMAALRDVFQQAWKSTSDSTVRDLMVAAKDDRKAELTAADIDLPF